MPQTMKTIGKLSLWGILLTILLWLGKQLLAYLLALIMPWVHWILGWLLVISGVILFLGFTIVLLAAYFAYRAWQRKREKNEKNAETA